MSATSKDGGGLSLRDKILFSIPPQERNERGEFCINDTRGVVVQYSKTRLECLYYQTLPEGISRDTAKRLMEHNDRFRKEVIAAFGSETNAIRTSLQDSDGKCPPMCVIGDVTLPDNLHLSLRYSENSKDINDEPICTAKLKLTDTLMQEYQTALKECFNKPT